MNDVAPVPIAQLRRRATLEGLDFATTADLQDASDGALGQERAFDALRLGAEIQAPGFHVFVTRDWADDLEETVADFLREKAKAGPRPKDWVYVHNFETPHRPTAIALPPASANGVRDAFARLIEELKATLPAAFDKQDYQARRAAIDDGFRTRNEETFQALGRAATEQKVAILRTPAGFAFAPMKGDEVMQPDEFHALPAEERQTTEARIKSFQERLQAIVREAPRLERERQEEVKKLNRSVAETAAREPIADARARVGEFPDALAHLARVESDVFDKIARFAAPGPGATESLPWQEVVDSFERYRVNVLIAQGDCEGCAPVIVEAHPTLANLVGRIEHQAMQGALFTNFTLIKPGALHRANGGYIVLDARDILSEPYAWTALKRALRTRQVKIEALADIMSLTSTVSLDPDPIPVAVKVVLVGDRRLQALLASIDSEFAEHFGIIADFEELFARSDENEALYARRLAKMSRDAGLRPLDKGAVAMMLEDAARATEDSTKLTLQMNRIRRLLFEADLCAGDARREVISAEHVARAATARVHRVRRVHEHILESTLRNIGFIETSGAKVGQVNALSVYAIGDEMFGRPSRVTARARPGAGKVVDIEREVELGGPLHSKGVLIITGFIAGRYALEEPMSLLASVVFEQSYGGIDGDSASSAELYAILSALSERPLRQDLAVTGSVNQHGQVQAIGGVNAKVEGFFDLCAARGLTGTQGVLVPQSNVQHLMLREDVVQACSEGRFTIYPIETIDEGAALLMNCPAGARDDTGAYPVDTINGKVEEKLRAFARVARAFARPGASDG